MTTGRTDPEPLCGLVGSSLAMRTLRRSLAAAARTRSTVLLIGESGSGKELAARAIHRMSGDPDDRFVAVNCAALSRDLVESELFGHVAGAFTGATGAAEGLLRSATGGTFLLDEISDMTVEIQAKLLRVLQEGRIRPVGAAFELPVHVRFVATLNRDPRTLIDGGLLRRDLYFRLERLTIHVPPLRDHREDLPELCDEILIRFAEDEARVENRTSRRATLADETRELLARHSWPGNVRELKNTLIRAALFARGSLLTPDDFPELRETPREEWMTSTRPAISLEEAERRAIAHAVRTTRGNLSEAARVLGISRKQLYVKIDRYRIPR